jgi:hypothetical protein
MKTVIAFKTPSSILDSTLAHSFKVTINAVEVTRLLYAVYLFYDSKNFFLERTYTKSIKET